MKKIKQILAKVMLVVVLLTSVLSLSGCRKLFGKYRAHEEYLYKSHAEFVEFIEKYNSKNDGFVSTFISFDFDSNETVSDRYYFRYMVAELNDYYDKVYDKYQNEMGINMFFYVDDIQIECFYGIRDNYNFYQDSEILMQFVESIHIDDTASYKIDFRDIRSFDLESNKYMRYYEYTNIYQVNINGKKELTVRIAYNEINQEKLDEICKLLMDNIVIINTEG
jgi:hypothetical protein